MSDDHAHAAAMGRLIEAARLLHHDVIRGIAGEIEEQLDTLHPDELRHPPQEPLRLRG